ncbi:MAG: HD domain-containing protein [Proteobacteria bacterium]|nr:HD domain-containing protein [Pseudomonadota bacterium]
MARGPEVRDPLHGAIAVSRHELSVMDEPLFQRLRHVRQLGFSDLAFPGAVHNRYLHSIGAMHLAGRAFDSIFEDAQTPPLAPDRRAAFRRLVRLAALLHDVGHAPFSHSVEFAMPKLEALQIHAYAGRPDLYPGSRQATHEDYTIKAITSSALTPVIEAGGIPALAVAGLIDPDLPAQPAWYEAGENDWRPLLQQLISSELDVDRMDYLARDSHFAGVHYGVFDTNWIMNNLAAHVVDGRVHLALLDRAIYAFDDFLLARYHMFVMVYFHYRSVAYEEMLRQYFAEDGDGWSLPADIEQYAKVDDHHLLSHLRASSNEWARRIVERREYKLLLERHGTPQEVDLSPLTSRLDRAGIPHLPATSLGVLSKYFDQTKIPAAQEPLPLGETAAPSGPPPIFVLHTPYRGSSERRPAKLEKSTALFDRYAGELGMSRIYVPPELVAEAGAAIADIA